MSDAASDWSKEQLLAHAAERGRRITPDQFDRWRKRGLLPSPVRHGLGQGLGMRSSYPESAAPQLVAAYDQLAKNRDADAALWRLWWDGFPIEESRIRPLLESALLAQEKFSGAMRELYDEDSDEMSRQFETAALARPKDRDIGRIRRRLGMARYASFVGLLSDVVSGNYASHDHEDASLVAKGLGAHGAPLLTAATLHAMGALFRTDRMRATFDAAQPGDFAVARDEVKLLLGRVIPLAIEHSESIFGVEIDGILGAMLSQGIEGIASDLVLIWLPIRAHPLFPVLFPVFSALLLRPFAEWKDRDIPTLIDSL